jgi:UDP-N-acetylmuramate dehydrogenase
MPQLANYTTLRLGGPALAITEATSEDELVGCVMAADDAGEELLLVAGGSNLVVCDEGITGPVVLIRTSGVEIDASDDALLHVAAGEPWDPFVARCVSEDRPGVACLSGIPGSVGATPIQNVGAYGQEVGDVVRELRVLDRKRGTIETMRGKDAEFGYRRSLIKRSPGRFVVLRVTFRLPRDPRGAVVRYEELARTLGVAIGDRVPALELRDAVLTLRASKGMVLDPRDPDTVSAGSFFMNPILDEHDFFMLQRRVQTKFGDGVAPPGYPSGADRRMKTSAAWLIERAGFQKGYGNPDGIAISSKHVLALTNRGAGTTAELIALGREVAAEVDRQFGVLLKPEPVFAGCDF